ncbi:MULTISPECIES: LysR family transcriptional regulator [Pseudomonas]|uniref:LysR family transcriptional regulator n=1 Tax=Pseudomonas TaxID=286 RepID=UPI0008A34A46|nr:MULTISPECIES: LysR family transcriptional regulator [Pseudomonas]MBA4994383.1 LysR family transcriptional regulator [Pseudomonas aeruginosa]OFR55450.1 LysR family transcriptional regulator [Pseudomonas sp. HMSC066A08]RUE48632.1 LysR family transcriptional regulator [Pseudomonas aeruginosa]
MQKMNAPLQYRLDHADLALVLALVRGGSLARAAELLRVDVSTVFRAIRRLEKNLGKALFDKSRSGYLANQTARRLAQQAELAEQALEAARIGLELEREVLSGTVRLTCSDAVLHGLLLPALARFMPSYPALQLELATSNDFANLSRRDADIALRMTRTPPEHLVGRNLGEVRYVLCASERYLEGRDAAEPAMLHWIAPDDFLPDHPSVVWRRRHYPGVLPAYRCNGVLAVAEMARAGLGLAAIPAYLLRDGDGLRVLDADLEGCASALWLLTRPDCRALRSVVALFDELGRHVRLGDE